MELITQQTTTTFKQEYDRLFNDLYPVLVHYAQKYLGDLALSEDIVQGAFINYWIKFSGAEKQNVAKKYLFRSVYNASIDHIRHKKVEEKRLDRYMYAHDDYNLMNDLVAESEIRKEIEKVKSGLPKKCCEIFRLSRDEGLSYKEISEKLNISIKTVETQVSKALGIFRRQLSVYL